MATISLIIGESGTGKSSSIRTLESKSTLIINVLNKPLPFKGWAKNYTALTKEKGNYFQSDKTQDILKTLDFVSSNRADIKNIIIDDFQYVMANEFMRRVKEKGYEKFNDIGKNAYDLIFGAQLQRQDLNIFFLSHSDSGEDGITRCKSIGKMLTEKVCIEGMFTIVMQTVIIDKQYMFIVQNNGHNTAKSPMGMFDTTEIPNDLKLVSDAITKYNS